MLGKISLVGLRGIFSRSKRDESAEVPAVGGGGESLGEKIVYEGDGMVKYRLEYVRAAYGELNNKQISGGVKLFGE